MTDSFSKSELVKYSSGNMPESETLWHMTRQLNEIGPGFCSAKWYTATIWLQNGRTSSCHHPPAHTIQHSDIENNPSGLHNTAFKKDQRKQMITGKRPSECGYCWRVEDASDTTISDRAIKSSCVPWADTFKNIVHYDRWPRELTNDHSKFTEVYNQTRNANLTCDELLAASTDDDDMIYTLTIDSEAYKKDFNPRILELSFDNLCNLNCSYCNTEFSSTWASDIKKNGPIKNLQTNSRGTYENAVEFDFDPKSEENIYIKKFFEWFNDGLKEDLKELRVTGGEPTRSPSFWKLVDLCGGADFKFSVNSNLIMDNKRLDKVISMSKKFNDFELFTSCEAYGNHANFIRSGLKYDMWISNLERFANEGKYKHITIMLTINALCLFSITDFLDDIVDLKKKFNDPLLFRLSINILRFPSFQSVNILPNDAKHLLAASVAEWLINNKDNITSGEYVNVERLINYLLTVDRGYEDDDLMDTKQNDFIEFYTQYGERNNMNFRSLFEDEFSAVNFNPF